MSINSRLDALAATVRNRLPGYTVYAPERAVTSSTLFPVIQVFPWREHLERTETGLWGNAMYDQAHSHGPDKYRLCLLQAPLVPDLDEDAAKRALNDAIDTVRDALVQNPALVDDASVAQALDAADYILTEYDGQGHYIQYHQRPYVGAYVTIDLQKLRGPSHGAL